MINLSKRNFSLIEKMDDIHCDPVLLENTYKQFFYINTIVSRWRNVYLRFLKPILETQKNPSLLDIGFGGGDLPMILHTWAHADKIKLRITAIDPDQRALEFVNNFHQDAHAKIEFKNTSLSELSLENRKFSVVISNHVLHHIPDEGIKAFMDQSKKVASHFVLHNDLQRSIISYYAFNLSSLFFRNSFITADGKISIQRSLRKHELQNFLDNSWTVEKLLPCRLLAYSFV